MADPSLRRSRPHLAVGRRGLLLGAGAALSMGRATLSMAAAPTEKRLVVVLLRGALDGLAAVVPYGDPDLAAWRGALLPPGIGQPNGMLDLGGFYGLHPSLTGMQRLYWDNDLLIVHAVAASYRSRSHFEAQDWLESGAKSEKMGSGWLNRAVALMPRKSGEGAPAVAVSVTVPLLLRGSATVSTWAPPAFAPLDPALYRGISELNRDDAIIGPAIANALKQRGFADSALIDAKPPGELDGFAYLASNAAVLLRNADGPRVAALEIEGWDTHSAQPGRIQNPLRDLDTGLVAMRNAMGDMWRDTVVLVITEFGRTVRANGTLGTDHGTGTVAFVAGGSVAGGTVRANWPGLKRASLFEDRDLQPTTELRAVVKGVLRDHLGLDTMALSKVFPGGEHVAPLDRLMRPAI